jgi:hypothetical protein
MANESFDANVERLVRIADGDLAAIHGAMQEVRATANAAGSPEHISYALLAAAWRRVADAPGRPPAGSR